MTGLSKKLKMGVLAKRLATILMLTAGFVVGCLAFLTTALASSSWCDVPGDMSIKELQNHDLRARTMWENTNAGKSLGELGGIDAFINSGGADGLLNLMADHRLYYGHMENVFKSLARCLTIYEIAEKLEATTEDLGNIGMKWGSLIDVAPMEFIRILFRYNIRSVYGDM